MDNGDHGVIEATISLYNFLPDDILERIFSFLPIASTITSASVCKRWYHIIRSKKLLWANRSLQQPWYFMFTSNVGAVGYAYDPVLLRWYSFFVPGIGNSSWSISSSYGLVCCMNKDSWDHTYVCNPITKESKKLVGPPGDYLPDYVSLAMSVDRRSHPYTVAVIKSKQVADELSTCGFSIQIYKPESESWVSSINEMLLQWRGEESAICNGFLYCLIRALSVLGGPLVQRLIVCDLSIVSSPTSLMQMSIPVPFSLTCCRLINLKERLLMVGGIVEFSRLDIFNGIGIWEHNKTEWQEVARMPRRYFRSLARWMMSSRAVAQEISSTYIATKPQLCFFLT